MRQTTRFVLASFRLPLESRWCRAIDTHNTLRSLGETDVLDRERGREEDSPVGGRGAAKRVTVARQRQTTRPGGRVREQGVEGCGAGRTAQLQQAAATTADKAVTAAGKATPTVNSTENHDSPSPKLK